MALVAVGFLLVFIFQYSSTSEATESITSFMYGMLWWKAVLIGCSISITMEALQFCFMKGFSEVDDVMLADVRRLMSEGRCLPQEQIDGMTDQELAVWYNNHVIYPDKVRLNCYYYRHYSFVKDIQMILCTVLGKKMEYAGETI